MPVSGTIDVQGVVITASLDPILVRSDVLLLDSNGAQKQLLFSTGFAPAGEQSFVGHANVVAGDQIAVQAHTQDLSVWNCTVAVTSGTYTAMSYNLNN